MNRSRTVEIFAVIVTLMAVPAGARKRAVEPEVSSLPRVESKLAGLDARSGLLKLHLDRERGRIWLELPATGEARYLYLSGLATGVGSNPVGLDRSQQGRTRVVQFRRVGGRVLLEELNLGFRARSERSDERAAVRDSFAFSVLWAGEIAALDPDGRALVDLTSFVVRDMHGIATTLKKTEQGSFEIDPERSVPDLDALLAFPDNVELEAVLTFAGSDPGPEIRRTVPAPEAVSLVLHHSFIRLPDDGYRPRRFDPRAGSFGISFHDYAAPLEGPLEVRWISRHRLQKIDSGQSRGPVVEPIVYYLDRGVPEPVRSALKEGASWWAEAFDAAGFEDAFRVEELPEGAHPLDARYNVIQWVHRATRGWSYGGGIIDPRTGEIVKGHVLLGSLRVRQDRLLFEGLAGAEGTGSGAADDPVELALARIRQLAAHEVGHTLGFTHNFAASTYGGRASVMDYPAPLIRVDEQGSLDFSDAYGVGVGAWDRHTVRYAYTELPVESEEAELERIVREGREAGLLFVADDDARPPGSAHPLAHLWDNGSDPVRGLELSLAVRRIALRSFGLRNLVPGSSVARLEELFAPVYFHHRYQLEAATKIVGGANYGYPVVGDPEPEVTPVSADWQRRALESVLATLDPAELEIPEHILRLLSPRPFGIPRHRELFRGRTAPVFDPLAAAATASDAVVGLLLEPARAARLVDQHRRDSGLPGLEELLDALIEASFTQGLQETLRRAELRRTIERTVVHRLITLAGAATTPPAVAVRLEGALRGLVARLRRESEANRSEVEHRTALEVRISRFLDRELTLPEESRPGSLPLPPGGPIGAVTACGRPG